MAQRTSPAPGEPGGVRTHIRPGEAVPPRARRAQPHGHGSEVGSARLTARGSALAMFSLFFPGTLTSGWVHLGALTGVSFLIGCVLAGLYTKREDLLLVVTTPPLIFLAAVICVTAVSSDGGGVLAATSGIALGLAAAAPWLLMGELAILLISLFRGLPRSVRNLRADLRGEP
ncbi:MAG: DUF6542 domain-containing protein [Actinomycetota bacterium]